MTSSEKTEAIHDDLSDLAIAMEFNMEAFLSDLPSEEEMNAEREAVYTWGRENLIAAPDIADRRASAEHNPMRFNLLSLPAWLAIAKHANVAHIPARPIASMQTADYLASMDNSDLPAFGKFHGEVISNLRADEMVRMEQVAPLEIKAQLSSGNDMSQGLIEYFDKSHWFLDLHEDRFYTTLKDLADPVVRAFARPIQSPRKITGEFREDAGEWPAEFRVFVENGEIVGISNYYPQVEMDADTFRSHIQITLALAGRMVACMNKLQLGVGNPRIATDLDPADPHYYAPKNRPEWMPENWGHQDFTLDFMVKDDNEVVFLEGGPAGMAAAHPCCFIQEGRAYSEDFLHGVALSDTKPILPLAEFL